MADKQQVFTLITGASKGIGRECSIVLAEAGFKIIGIARKRPTEKFPGEFYEVDLADRESLTAFLAEICKEKSITGLINNAGVVGPELLADINLTTLDSVFEVNLVAATLCAKYCSQAMKRLGKGRIVNISTELILGAPTRTAYGGSKAALASASRTWALELAKYHVTVNAIAPGPVDTELFRQNNPEGSAIRAEKLARIPLGRLGRPRDIANVVKFLMSDEASYITGQTLHIDGGSSIASAPFI